MRADVLSPADVAFGIGGKIGFTDTEHGSGDLYAHLGDYDVIGIEAPHPSQYTQAIKALRRPAIPPSSSTACMRGPDGGLLDKQREDG